MKAYSTLTDHELADLLKTEDHFAFTAIYKRYWKKIYVTAFHRLGDSQDAEEIVQDIFLNLWRKRTSFTLTTGFNNYFSIAVKFEIMDLMKKRSHIHAYERATAVTFSEADDSTLRQLDLHELQERLQLTINSLPEKCRIVFKLKHEQGYSQQQIASELDISEKTVEAHLAKAKKVLRGTFGNLFFIMLFL